MDIFIPTLNDEAIIVHGIIGWLGVVVVSDNIRTQFKRKQNKYLFIYG